MTHDLAPCTKQHVMATAVTVDGERFTGTNGVRHHQPVCPRDAAGFARGEGYHLCVEVCGQPGHAEVMALKAAIDAGANIIGARVYLEGHHAACSGCEVTCHLLGVGQIVVGSPP